MSWINFHKYIHYDSAQVPCLDLLVSTQHKKKNNIQLTYLNTAKVVADTKMFGIMFTWTFTFPVTYPENQPIRKF